jgi:hypothetical protein
VNAVNAVSAVNAVIAVIAVIAAANLSWSGGRRCDPVTRWQPRAGAQWQKRLDFLRYGAGHAPRNGARAMKLASRLTYVACTVALAGTLGWSLAARVLGGLFAEPAAAPASPEGTAPSGSSSERASSADLAPGALPPPSTMIVATRASSEAKAPDEEAARARRPDAPRCKSDARLMIAAIDDEHPSASLAVVSTASAARMIRPDATLEGKRVARLTADRVYLEDGDAYCYLDALSPTARPKS